MNITFKMLAMLALSFSFNITQAQETNKRRETILCIISATIVANVCDSRNFQLITRWYGWLRHPFAYLHGAAVVQNRASFGQFGSLGDVCCL